MDTIILKKGNKLIIPIVFKKKTVVNTTLTKEKLEEIITPKPLDATVKTTIQG